MPEPTSEFNSLMATSYQGELLGEALFSSLASPGKNGATVRRLRSCRSRTGDAELLRPVLTQLDIDPGDDGAHRQKGEAQAELLGDNHAPVHGALRRRTTMVIDRYNRLRSVSPPDTYWPWNLLIAHEEALASFASARAGRGPDVARSGAWTYSSDFPR